MGIEKKAEVEIDAKGAERAAAAARSALQPWSDYAERARTSFQGFRQSVGDAVGSVISDLGRVVTVGSSISFAGAVACVESFEKATAQLAIAARRDVESIRTEFNDLGQKLGERPEALAHFVSSVGQVTYNFKEAQANLGAFKTAATDWGRPIESLAGLQVALSKLGVKDAERALGQIRANAEALGTVGGPAALADQFVKLQSVWERVASKGPEGQAQNIALAGVIGKGLSPYAAERAQSRILGDLVGDVDGWQRYLRDKGELGSRESLTDEQGNVKNLPDYLARVQRAWRKDPHARRDAQLYFGPQEGAAFLNMDARRLEELAAQQKQSDALRQWSTTDAGQRDMNAAKRDVAMQGVVGSQSMLGGVRQWFDAFSADHPLGAKGLELGTAGAFGYLANAARGWIAGGGGAGAARGGGSLLGAVGRHLGAGGARAAALDAAAEGGWLGTTGLGGSSATGAAAGGGLVLLSALLAGKGLSQLGEASAVHQGFDAKGVSAEDAARLAHAAAVADAAAPGQRSAGQKSALVLERERLARQAAAGVAVSADDPMGRARAAFQAVRRLGGDEGEAERLAKLIAAELRSAPIQINIVDASGGVIAAQQEFGSTTGARQ